MPYIKQESRPEVDKIYDMMIGNNVDINDISEIMNQFCEKNIEPSYNNYKNFFAEINECCKEVERRMDLECDMNYAEEVDIRRKCVLSSIVACMDILKVNGDLNYLLYRYIYNSHEEFRSSICDILLGAVDHLRGRYLAPYEDEKIKENGDVT